ncbi:putative acetoacetyl-CoA thiolase [Lipomyces japonicus]|uniref:putative acetoacetyl-CoA thiolase n=1 Tax=Lipomyces japonicus TaxID=56871 RepID=UPI0034CD0DAE
MGPSGFFFPATKAMSASSASVLIVSAARTAVGKFNGRLKSVTATELGAIAATAAIDRAGIENKSQISELFFGQVLQANVGQSPARQVAIKSGLPSSVDATTINKVCSSGLKSIIFASQNISSGNAQVMVAGGMESMSNAPYYIARGSTSFGHTLATDSILRDGLWDRYNDMHMGLCAENTAEMLRISKEAQDKFALESYRRARNAIESGVFKTEIVPVNVKTKTGPVVFETDEEPVSASLNLEKLPGLKSAFKKNGTVTAGNASPISDGASALVLASEDACNKYAYASPLARIVAYADAARDPIDFTIAPSLAIPKVLSKAGLELDDMSLIELNEAFAVVALANIGLLGLDLDKVNVNGGAVALGHAIGSSGSRIVVSLAHALQPGQYGLAAICNGGGGSSALIIQRL